MVGVHFSVAHHPFAVGHKGRHLVPNGFNPAEIVQGKRSIEGGLAHERLDVVETGIAASPGPNSSRSLSVGLSVAEEIQTPVLEIDPVGPVDGDEMEAHEKSIPIPLLFVNAAGNDVIVRKGAVSPANHAAPQGADRFSGFGRQFVQIRWCGHGLSEIIRIALSAQDCIPSPGRSQAGGAIAGNDEEVPAWQ